MIITACKIREWYFYTPYITYRGIVPPWKSVIEIQPFEVLSDGKGNAVFLLPVIFHKSLNNERPKTKRDRRSIRPNGV